MSKRRIFAWQTDTAACFYYRIWLPLTHLSGDRWDVGWGAPPPDIHDYEIVIGQRIAGPNEGWHNLCRDPNILAVYDIDDDLLNVDPANTVPHSIYAPLRDETIKNIAAADLVTVSTPKLAELMCKYNPEVTVLPNCLHPELPYRDRTPSGEPLVVGWGGSMFHSQDWVGFTDVLEQLRSVVPHVSFHTVGADYTGGRVGARVTGWSDINSYHRALDFDIGVAPLLRSTFNESKSWIKTLEYAALGIPAVTTAAGQYVDWVEHGVNGFLVHNDRHWVDFLLALADDETRRLMSEAARWKAREWTIDGRISLWENAYA